MREPRGNDSKSSIPKGKLFIEYWGI